MISDIRQVYYNDLWNALRTEVLAMSLKYFDSSQAAADELWNVLGPSLRVGTPLGLGKPNALLNCIYRQAERDPQRELTLFTALSLNPPILPAGAKPTLESRFLGPFAERHWGKDYPILEYAQAAQENNLPKNVRIHEFYLHAGSSLSSPRMQQDYQSLNYTHVAQQLLQSELNVVVQLIAAREENGRTHYSLSCNPDVVLDLVDLYRKAGKRLFIVGVIHPDLPFMGGDAAVAPETFAMIVRDPSVTHRLFALPRMPIDPTDHAIGFHASRWIADGGTIQIGIGSLSEAVVAALILRHQANAAYRALCEKSDEKFSTPTPAQQSLGTFSHGLYGLSEMVMDGFMHLRKVGILTREVTERDSRQSNGSTYLHGAFFLGSAPFYEWLRNLEGKDFDGLKMTRVSQVNDLYDPRETLLRQQRLQARFLNTCMEVTILGGAASETLRDGRVVSGVGGQYNFVAMAHELKDARSILMLRSTRMDKGHRRSNIVASHGHLTIPRHLRDIIVTEYGAADLRGKTDEQVIISILEITDSEFQEELLKTAQATGKVSATYRLPQKAKQNRPELIRRWLIESQKTQGDAKIFSAYPFGSDFTPIEQKLTAALNFLKQAKAQNRLFKLLIRSLFLASSDYSAEIQRMKLEEPLSFRERMERRLLIAALAEIQALIRDGLHF